MTAPPPAAAPASAAAPDQAARDAIGTRLGETLFVEAGAGSGKTSSLVERVLALVAGGVPLSAVAAITFTEKAGAELRDRIRRALEERAAGAGGPVEHYRTALDELDGAAIGTLHAFAQRLLSEHPVEAGLPPRVEVLDEVASDVEFDRRWRAFVDRLIDDPALERALGLFFSVVEKPAALRVLAAAFDQQWDLVADRVPERAPDPPEVGEHLEPALRAVEAACRRAGECRVEGDRMLGRLGEFAAWVERLRGAVDEADLLSRAVGPGQPSLRLGNVGQSGSWPDLPSVKADLVAAGELLAAAAAEVTDACARRIAVELRRFTLEAAAARRAEGRLAFHDLLVLARTLLRDPDSGPAVRAALAERYQRLLLDEFQDTDPIQIELAVRIAAVHPDSPEAGSAPWPEVAVERGRLFVVGDPKQSIYRFRRADIAVFLQARDRFAPEAGGTVELTANFRTVAPVIDWVNAVFGTLMGGGAETAGVPAQPAYVPLQAVRDAPPVGPPVSVVGREALPAGTPADELRAAEATQVAAAVARVVAEGWSVQDRRTGEWRPARLGDITVLVPARTSLPFLEDALEERGIAFRAESASLVYATRAVRDLLMTLRAVDDPTDHLSVVSALRTPLFGCGDDDLYRFRVERRGRFGYLGDQPDTVPADDPVRAALAYLGERHGERWWRSPSEMLERVVRDRRVLELGFADARPRDVWRRVRFVVDAARAWREATGGTLREYLQWVDQQCADGVRVAEAVLPETDDEAVRVMTVHAAKGLEFPVTVLSGMSTRPGGRPAPAQVAFPPAGGVGYRFGARVTTPEYEAFRPVDEQMQLHERVRLLYVATTRARDHLVVSLTRVARAKAAPAEKLTNAELLVRGMAGPDGGAGVLDDLPDAAAAGSAEAVPVTQPRRPEAPAPFAEWAAERSAALALASRLAAVAATALGPEGELDPEGDLEPVGGSDPGPVDGDLGPAEAGLRKRPRDLDLPPWLKGRYGTSVGRAVHGVLQTVDLAGPTDDDLAAAVAAQCEAEAVPDRVAAVRRLAEAALGSDVVRAAAAAPHWREVYVCVPAGESLLEGYVDLLYRGPDGLVVVDYKTAASADDEVLDARLEVYRSQGEAYRRCVAEATGEAVADVVFLFLTPDGVRQRRL